MSERHMSRAAAFACIKPRNNGALVDRFAALYATPGRTAGRSRAARDTVSAHNVPTRVPQRKSDVQQTLFQKIAAKDPAAVKECIDRFGGLVWSLSRRFSAGDGEAEDAVQEIFVNLWRSAERFDPAVASEATFVAMIARRRLIDRNRARSRQITAEPIHETTEAGAAQNGSPLESSDEGARAARVLNSLTPEQQRVLRLSVYRGLSHEQIAQATGLPLGTVKTHIRRGLIKVRELLEQAPSSPCEEVAL
jgi:RNA polymerase sigma factor (sigma-70 family)